MKLKIKIYLITLAFIITSNLSAQVPNSFESISIKDGLSHNEIWAFEQDKYGYMWIATQDGLNKYDGYNFEIYKNNPDDPNSLPSNVVTHVLEDHSGTLWVSTSSGLSKFDRTTKSFKNYRFSESSGEQVNFVQYLFEDSRNTLWLSTINGYLSFDRKTESFKEYEILRDDNSIASQALTTYTMIETKNGVVYGSSAAYGLVKFDYENNLFVQLKLKSNFQNKLIRVVGFTLAEDPNGFLWYGTNKNLVKIDPVSLEGEVVVNKLTGREFGRVGSIFIDKNENIWIGSESEGFHLYNLKTQKTTKLSLSVLGYFDFYLDKSGILWMGSLEGVFKYSFDKAPYELYTMKKQSTETKPVVVNFSLSSNNPDIIWLATTQGLQIFDKERKVILDESPLLNKVNIRKNIRLNDVLESQNKKLYLANVLGGLHVFDLKSGKSELFTHQRYDNSTIYPGSINTLLEDSKKQIWIGQLNGLNILDESNKSLTQIPSFLNRKYSNEVIAFLRNLRKSRNPVSQIIKVEDYANITKEFVLPENSNILISGIGEGLRQWSMVDYGWLESSSGDTLWSMHDLDYTFYAGGGAKNRHQIGLLNLEKGRYKLHYKSDDSHSYVSYNAPPPQDSLYWGIEIYTINADEHSKYNPILIEDSNRTFMHGANVGSLFESSDKQIWVATAEGLSVINPESLVIKNYRKDTGNKLSLSDNTVEDICEDKFGNIWVATQDGLNKFDRTKNEIKIYREKDGLPSNNLRALLLDDDGNLWVSSIKGISKVEIQDNDDSPIIVNYDVRDGLQGYTFLGSASIKDLDGKMYFSGTDGFNGFTPGVTDKSLPYIVFSDLSISNKSISELYENLLSTKDLNEIDELNLSYNQNDLSFEFASIHFSRPDKNRLQYKMEGIDESWHDGSRRFASYTNLDPGEYIFKVRGSNGDGFWVDDPKIIKVTITPAWWNNIYAYFGYGLIFFGFLYGIRKFEMERRSRVSEYKQSQLRAEAAELKAKAAEAERKLLEAENERKSQELEEARSLQLSMLPRELPQLPNLDIAVYMKTATEVGGDYYDFHVGMDGVLTVVLGDATGHGMKAGTMVTTTKSLFNVLAPNPNIVDTFHEMTRCLKLMHMEKLAMCMSMLKIAGSKVQMSSAGMPPIFIYKKDERVIEEHVIKGMPLGTMVAFPYTLKESNVNTGDTILIMSDGFPELLNDANEAFGYKRVRNLFEEHSAKTPEDIISVLKNEGDIWINNTEPDDDITFVVIKVK